MSNAIDRLRSLLVSDVMSRNVVQISTCQTIPEVAAIFAEHNIASAPVVDEQGRCVGILSASDCLKRPGGACSDSSVFNGSQRRLIQKSEDRPLEIVSSTDDLACSYMTDAVQTVAPETTLLAAARIMRAAHIHHLVALDAQYRPIGVVSTMDIVTAVLKSVEEIDLSHNSASSA